MSSTPRISTSDSSNNLSAYQAQSPTSSPRLTIQTDVSPPSSPHVSTTDVHEAPSSPKSPKSPVSTTVTPPPPRYDGSTSPVAYKQELSSHLRENYPPCSVGGGLSLALDTMVLLDNGDGATAVSESVHNGQGLLGRNDTEAYKQFQHLETEQHVSASDDEYQTSTGKNLRGLSEDTRATLHQIGAHVNDVMQRAVERSDDGPSDPTDSGCSIQ